jgi:cobalt-zinc-cadmium resistance protein CzcA
MRLPRALALVISLVIALVVVPVSVGVFHRHQPATEVPSQSRLKRVARAMGRNLAPIRERLAPMLERARRGYGWLVDVFVGRASASVAVVVALLVVAYLLYGRIGTDFLPAMDEGSIILDYWTPPGTSLTETDAMLREAERVIISNPAVASYSRRTGEQLGFFITEPNRGDYVIKLKPRRERPGVEAIMDDLRTRIQAVEPAIHTDFGQLLEDNIGDLTGGAPQPIDVKIFGSDPAILAAKADQAAHILEQIPGVEDVFNGITIAGPALQVHVDPVAAARFGLNTQTVAAEVEPAVTGTVAGQIRIGDRMYDLRVLAADSTPLPQLKIRAGAPSSALIPLSTVATVTTGTPETEINRENLRTYVGVTARLSGRDLGGAMADIRQRITRDLALGPGLSVEYGGLYDQQQK